MCASPYRDDGRPIHLPELKNIRLVPLKAVKYFYNMAVLPAYLRRNHALLCGTGQRYAHDPPQRGGAARHPPLVMDTDRGFFRFKFWVHCLSTKWFARKVYTVSEDQRRLISDKLGIPLDKIGVTYNGWEHMKQVTPDESIFDKLPGDDERGILLRPGQSGQAQELQVDPGGGPPQPRQDLCGGGGQGPACLR